MSEQYRNITIITTLDDLELVVGAGVREMAARYDIEPTDDDLRACGAAAAKMIVHIVDAAAFANKTSAELDSLPLTSDDVTQKPVTHRPEFGFFEPPV